MSEMGEGFQLPSVGNPGLVAVTLAPALGRASRPDSGDAKHWGSNLFGCVLDLSIWPDTPEFVGPRLVFEARLAL